jgi:hypothetical protein
VLLWACYGPTIQPGSPCDADHPCPSSLVCAAATSTCERADVDASAPPADTGVVDILVDGCTPSGFDECGDGQDQDCDGNDVTCEPNDLPPDAIDITAGGTFTADLRRAHDDVAQHGCGGDGGRDVFYRVTLATAEVYYFDTFGSNFDMTLRVFRGKDCTNLGTALGPACSDDACNSADAQLAVSLPAGTSCVVVDQNMAATDGSLVLNVARGGRDGLALATTVSGDTCNATNVSDPTNMCTNGNVTGGKDIGYFFTVCPNQTRLVDATTCSSATSYTFDTVLYVRKTGEPDVACNDDSSVCPVRPDRPDHADGSIIKNAAIAGPGLGWVVVDGFQADSCGPYTMTSVLH